MMAHTVNSRTQARRGQNLVNSGPTWCTVSFRAHSKTLLQKTKITTTATTNQAGLCGLVIERLLALCEALGSIPKTPHLPLPNYTL